VFEVGKSKPIKSLNKKYFEQVRSPSNQRNKTPFSHYDPTITIPHPAVTIPRVQTLTIPRYPTRTIPRDLT
jgi:hypothetical protein